MRHWLRWLPFLIVFVEAVLLVTGVLTLGQAAVLLLVLEGLLVVVVLSEFGLLLRAYRTARHSAATRSKAFSAAVDAVLPRPIGHLVRQEFRVFGAIYGTLRRKRRVKPDDRVVTYGGNLYMLLIAMVAVSIIEVVVVELFIPWNWLRWALVILGGYGLLWVLGFGCSLYTRPHTVGRDELGLRFAIFSEVTVPLANVKSASKSLCGTHKKSVEVIDGTLSFSVLGTTNVSVPLEPPVEVNLGRLGRHMVHRLRFYADGPARASAAVRDGAASVSVRPAADDLNPAT
jgi:hypothetical protein